MKRSAASATVDTISDYRQVLDEIAKVQRQVDRAQLELPTKLADAEKRSYNSAVAATTTQSEQAVAQAETRHGRESESRLAAAERRF